MGYIRMLATLSVSDGNSARWLPHTCLGASDELVERTASAVDGLELEHDIVEAGDVALCSCFDQWEEVDETWICVSKSVFPLFSVKANHFRSNPSHLQSRLRSLLSRSTEKLTVVYKGQ